MGKVKHKRPGYVKKEEDFTAKGILDVIKADYIDRYVTISNDFNQFKALFSESEWIDILTKSRRSLESKIRNRNSI